MENITVERFPLIFGFREVVLCKGFVAGVTVESGHALVEHESGGGWWISGVNPGPLADGGESFSLAIQNFCGRFREVLADFASEAADFAAFEKFVTDFFYSSDKETQEEWEAAKENVRRGATLGDLPKDTSAAIPRVTVAILQIIPQHNVRATSQAGMTALAA